MDQAVSLVGAVMILAAYAGNQMGWLDRLHPAYSWLNVLGALILTVIAFRAQQWGFVLLEGVWTIVSVPPLFRPRPRPEGEAHCQPEGEARCQPEGEARCQGETS